MGEFKELNDWELQEVEGGITGLEEIALIVGIIVGTVEIYGVVKDAFYTAGKEAAYKELGYK